MSDRIDELVASADPHMKWLCQRLNVQGTGYEGGPDDRALREVKKAMSQLATIAREAEAEVAAKSEVGHKVADAWQNEADNWKARALEAEDSVRDLMGAMRRWGAEEDGIPGDSCIGAWQAYGHAKCLLCPSRHEFRCTLYDEQRNTICEPCPVCGAIRKHSFASFIVLNADGTSAVVCNDTCARKYQAAREAVKS